MEQITAEQLAEVKTYLNRFCKRCAELVADMSSRIDALDTTMGDRVHLLSDVVSENLIFSRRVLTTIHSRTSRIEKLRSTEDTDSIVQAYQLAISDLEFPPDPMTSLVGAKELPPLPPAKWQETLESAISAVEQSIADSTKELYRLDL